MRVIRKLSQAFPSPEARTAAEAELDSYLERSNEVEAERVLLAILKLSEGDQTKLLHFVDVALRDPRDVIAWAEYPEETRLEGDEPPAVLEAARARDAAQYARWLED